MPARTSVTLLAVSGLLALSTACSSAPTPPPAPPVGPAKTTSSAPPKIATAPTVAESAVTIPSTVKSVSVQLKRVASGLKNPRGIFELPNRQLLVSEAGTGDPANPNTGALLRLSDKNADGDYDDAGERVRILEKMHSANVIDIVRRDEVFGMAAIAHGGGSVLVAHSMFGSPTTIFEFSDNKVEKWAFVHGNLNALVHDPKRNEWFAVSSSSDEVVRVKKGGGSKRVVKFPPLERGQDAVPGYLRYEPSTGAILVSLFSGSPEGEEGGSGIELVKRAGAIVRVDPESGKIETVVAALTAPTDFVLDESGRYYILELCDGFLDPIPNRAAMNETVHGGFRRFSGRLLRVDPKSGEVVELASGLDTPTNLLLKGKRLYIAQGMGTPARKIPGPKGAVGLDGFIDELTLPD